MAQTETQARKAPRGAPKAKGTRDDHGRLARMAAFWSLTLLLLFGCTFLHGILVGFVSMRDPILGIRIPVIGVDLSGAFLVSLAVFCVGVVAILRWERRPKVATLLGDTESELKKVTWPTPQEVMNSSMVVIVSVVLIGFFLAFVDLVLARVMKALILGSV